MKNVSFRYLCLGILVSLCLMTSCDDDDDENNEPQVPVPSSVAAKLGAHLYNCATTPSGLDNPCALVFANTAKLRIAVTGVSVPQFSQSVTFEKTSFPNPSNITFQNGTQTNSSHKIAVDGCVNFEIPSGDACVITASFKEGQGIGAGACSGPAAGLCFRWMKIVNIAAGQLSGNNCAGFVFIIDDDDPDGFTGSCN